MQAYVVRIYWFIIKLVCKLKSDYFAVIIMPIPLCQYQTSFNMMK